MPDKAGGGYTTIHAGIGPFIWGMSAQEGPASTRRSDVAVDTAPTRDPTRTNIVRSL